MNMTFMTQSVETMTHTAERHSMHVQKVVDIVTGSGSKTTPGLIAFTNAFHNCSLFGE